jgi:hypothetical protein
MMTSPEREFVYGESRIAGWRGEIFSLFNHLNMVGRKGGYGISRTAKGLAVGGRQIHG